MLRRRSSLITALVLCAACSFDPGGFGGGGGGGIGGDRGDAGDGTGGSDGGQGIDASVSLDAQPALCDSLCPGACDQDGTCNIICGSSGDGGGGGGGGGLLPGDGPPPCGAVACPAGLPCHVLCIGRNACDQPIDCTQSASCVVDCNDEGTCASQVTCGAGSCEVHCGGRDSCGGGVECQSSCFCDVSCKGESSCGQQTSCPPGCDSDPDCKTSGTGCASSC